MTLKNIIKSVVWLLGAGLLLFAVAGKTRLIRPDPLSALACSTNLLIQSPAPMDTIRVNRDTIAFEARQHDLPPELLAVIIYNHQVNLTLFRRFTDCFGSAMGYNLSLGLAQIRLSTAVEDTGRRMENLTPAEFHTVRRELLNPATNIAYQARELRLLLDRKHRFPGIAADDIIHNPAATALLMSEYRAGRTNTPKESSRLSANALFGMRYFLDERFYIFDRQESDIAEIKQQMSSYLEYIACDSGIFNDAVCADWKAEHPQPVE